jgi:hypothetical protein
MAVVNVYSNPVISSNLITKSGRALTSNGADGCLLFAQAAITSTDNNGSIYRLFKNLNRNITILGIQVANTVLTTGTSYGLGLYATDLSTTLYTTAAYFSGAMNLVTGHANLTSGYLDGMLGITMATAGAGYLGFPTLAYQNRLFEHAGFTTASSPSTPDSFDLCLTATTASTVTGTVAVLISFAYD